MTAGQDLLSLLPATALVVSTTAKNFRWDLTFGHAANNTVTEARRTVAAAILRVPSGTTVPTLNIVQNTQNQQIVAVSEHMIAYTVMPMDVRDLPDTNAERFRWKGNTTVARKLKPGDILYLVIQYDAITATGVSLECHGSIQYFLLY